MKGSKYPGGTSGKDPAGDVRDTGLIPGLGTSPRGRHGNPLQVFLPGEWQNTVHGVAKSQTLLKRLSMHACNVATMPFIPWF